MVFNFFKKMNAEPDSGIEIICDNTQSAGRLINCARLESVESCKLQSNEFWLRWNLSDDSIIRSWKEKDKTLIILSERTQRKPKVTHYEIQSTPDNSNPRQLEPRANSNQNRFPLDFRHTFTVILPSVTRTPGNSNQFSFPFRSFSI